MSLKRNTFCTIISPDYYPYAQALLESLEMHSSKKVMLEVLLSEKIEDKTFFKSFESTNLKVTFLEEIHDPITEKLYSKYYYKKKDAFRWSMKSVFIKYLLEIKGYEKVIFLDPDLFFFNDPHFLFEMLDEYRVILSPHWRCSVNPEMDMTNFKLNFRDGIYNGGFIGVRNDAQEIMDFWTNLCLVACEKSFSEGLYDDQKYLDILHSLFEGIGVVRHKGCNLASWNRIECRRDIVDNGKIMINSLDPVVFIHFTKCTMQAILSGLDQHLFSHFETYALVLNKFNPKIDLFKKAQKELDEILMAEKKRIRKQNSLIKTIRRKLRIRTRIKKLIGL